MEKKIIVILGATSTGKSELGVKLAHELNGEIISADSRQVYKGLNLTSGKVKGEWMHARKYGIHSILTFIYKDIPHHCIDFVKTGSQYTAELYQRDATNALKKINTRNRVPIIVGGTGFYIDALVGGISFPEVPPDEDLRSELENHAPSVLLKRLEELDPYRASRIDPGNTRRMIRAIEVATALGKVPPLERSPLKNVLKIGIKLPTAELHKRIERRLGERFEAGMIEEVRLLHSMREVSWTRLEELGMEVRYIARFLRKQIDEKSMRDQLLTEIKRFARRQMTYWRRDTSIRWFKSSTDPMIEETIRTFIL